MSAIPGDNRPGLHLPYPRHIHYAGAASKPVLVWRSVPEAALVSGQKNRSPLQRLPLRRDGPGRWAGEWLWVAELPALPPGYALQFYVEDRAVGDNNPVGDRFYCTLLRTFWLQDRQVFAYRPAPRVSPSQVLKIPSFAGSLPARALYIYLPRGYRDHKPKAYPVIYMQDGQNVFQAYETDSHVGSWMAEQAADLLIAQGAMREVIIVGVSHGGRDRLVEYLPPFATMAAPQPERASGSRRRRARRVAVSPATVTLRGRADRTISYYQQDVVPFIRNKLRVLSGRADTGLCGSSMGGLFSLYVAMEHPQFARHYAALSPALGVARNEAGAPALRARLDSRLLPEVRLWIDSGTQTAPGQGTDGMEETRAFWDSLLAGGAISGPDFQYHLFEGAIHHESDWAARLPRVFRFLFPAAGSLF